MPSEIIVRSIGALFADLTINKPLGLSPRGIEFRRAHLYDVNPVGMGAMVGAVPSVVAGGIAALAVAALWAAMFPELRKADRLE